jgi:hypothetical protein
MSTVGRHLPKWKLTDIFQAPKTLGDFSLRRNPRTNQDPNGFARNDNSFFGESVFLIVRIKNLIVMSTVGRHLPKWKLTDISQAPKTLGDFSLRRNPLAKQDPNGFARNDNPFFGESVFYCQNKKT